MQAKHSCSKAYCWRFACEWCPEVFAQVNKHTHKRWKVCIHPPPTAGQRQCKVTPPTLQKLTVLTHSL
eukprot:2935649-Amphidinium_carterae.1